MSGHIIKMTELSVLVSKVKARAPGSDGSQGAHQISIIEIYVINSWQKIGKVIFTVSKLSMKPYPTGLVVY